MQDYKTKNAQQIIKDLKDVGFVSVVCSSSTPDSWEKVAKITRDHPDFVIPAFGLHPWYINQAPTDWEERLSEYLKEFTNAQVGECGLDRLKAEIEGQEEVFERACEISEIGGIVINGLMCVAPICEKESELRAVFSNMHRMFIDIGAKKLDNVNMNILSMGMSGDYENAILEGANLVRIGSAIFGARVYR
jgi:hypothetical protein